MVDNKKCSCKVLSNNKKTFRNCKLSVYKKIKGINYCYIHAQKNFYKYATIIQRIQRGKRCREIIDNIYKQLPSDIQYIILFYLKKEIYYKRYINSHAKIYLKRFDIIDTTINNIFYNIWSAELWGTPPDNNKNWNMYLIDKLVKSYSLLIKNWKDIRYILYYSSAYNNKYLKEYIMKFYLITTDFVWGSTIWNSIPLHELVEYTNYDNVFTNEENLLIDKFYHIMKVYNDAFRKTFIYIRINNIKADIKNTQISDDQIVLNIPEFD
tara:strand:+ start:3112 stop:3912 length:801 start_codon:yes stop_codon:yes gene_type:complete